MEVDAAIAAKCKVSTELHQLLRQAASVTSLWRRAEQPMKTMQAQQWAWLTAAKNHRILEMEESVYNRIKSVRSRL